MVCDEKLLLLKSKQTDQKTTHMLFIFIAYPTFLLLLFKACGSAFHQKMTMEKAHLHEHVPTSLPPPSVEFDES